MIRATVERTSNWRSSGRAVNKVPVELLRRVAQLGRWSGRIVNKVPERSTQAMSEIVRCRAAQLGR
jgi:hypothetical protein